MAKLDIRSEGDLLLVAVHGQMESDEVISVIKGYYSNGVVRNVIWDFTNGSLQASTQKDLMAIAAAVKQTVDSGVRRGGKTTFVGSANVEYGLLRMYTAIAEITGVTTPYNVFRTMEEARLWIGLN